MNKKGFTLAETVTAAAIIAVCAAVLWAGYRSAAAAMGASALLSGRSDAAFALTQRGGEISRGSVSFSAGGVTYTVEGDFMRGQADGTVYYSFRPGGDAP